MTSQLTAKIRLVKCPRCRKVLPESANVPVYKCGGCDAVLQVKKHKNGINDIGLHIHETDVSQQNEAQHDSEDRKIREVANEGEHSVEKINETKTRSEHHSEDMDCFISGRASFESAIGESDDNKLMLKHIKRDNQDGKGSESQENCLQNQESSPVDEAHDGVPQKGKGSEGISPSNELTCHEIEDLSPETVTSDKFDADAISHYIFGNLKKKKVPVVDPTDSVETSQKISREGSSTREDAEVELITSKETLENEECPVNQNLHFQVLPPNEHGCQELEDLSPVVGLLKTELKENSLSRFIFENLTPGGSVINSPKLPGESRLEENHISPQLREPSRFDSVSSEKEMEKAVFANVDSIHGNSHAYDGSESSFRETDDQDTDQYLHLIKGKYTEAEPSQVSALPTRRYPISLSREKKPHASKGHGRRVRSRMQVPRVEQLSRAHFHSRVSPVGYNYGSCSNSVPNHGKNSNLPPKPEDQEDEKLNWDKLIFELQVQLNRSRTPKTCYRDELKDVPRYPNIYYQREAFPNQCKFSRIPFSAKAAINRSQMGHSCLQFSPRDCHCSSPISPHFYSKPSQCTAHLNCNKSNTHCSCSTVCIKTCDIICNNDYIERNYARRHVLPVKGGAPLVVCDNCSKLLHFPGDFLLFRKRYHQLRCSSCSYVLKYSLRNGYKLDRYVDDKSGDLAPAPPPSEVGDLREMNKGKKVSHVDPVCFSDHYAPSICKSCSTETEPISVVLPFDVQKRESNGKRTIYGGSVHHLNLRKHQSVHLECQNLCNNRIS